MIRFFVNKASVVFTFSFLIVLSGIISYIRLPRESAPEIKQPYIFITTTYLGVSARDMENLVTRVIEDEINGVDGLIEITSSSQQGLSFIFTKFASDITVETALRRIQQRVDRARPELPEDAEEPSVQELSSSSFPILIISLSHQDGIGVIDKTAEDLEEDLRKLPGILDVTVAGNLDKKVLIELDPVLLSQYKLSIDDVIDAVKGANSSIPGGILKNQVRTYSINVNSEIRTTEQFENIMVSSGSVSVPLNKIGTVSFTFSEPETYSRFNGKPAITLSLTKRSGENIINIVDLVKSHIDSIKTNFPQGTQIQYSYDGSDDIRKIIADLENNMFSGFILVMLVTVIFLGFVNSLFVSLAIPFSMLLSFTVLQFMNITLNMVVLFSLILALGMLVDNGIVIVENIFRHGSLGKSQKEAAIDGSNEVAWPIITSTITTCLAFFPIIFMPDVMGDFMAYIPITVIVVLLASLCVALTINPVFCSRFLKVSNSKHSARMTGGGRMYNWMLKNYVHWLHLSLKHTKKVLAGAFIIVVMGFILYGLFGKETVFFPSQDPSELIITAKMPQGTPLEKTDCVIKNIEHIVSTVPASIKNVQATSGRSGNDDVFSGIGEEYNEGFIRLSLKPFKERKIKGITTEEELKKRLKGFSSASIEINEQEDGPPSGHDISYSIVGDDYSILGMFADSVLEVLRQYPELKLIDTDFEAARPELNIIIDRKKAAFYHLGVQQIASTIRSSINGSIIGSYRSGEDDYDIIVRFVPQYRSSISNVKSLYIIDKDGVWIPLTHVSSIASGSSVGTIKRYDFQRSVSVWADFFPDFQNKRIIQHHVDTLVYGMNVPFGYKIKSGQGFEMRQEATSFLLQAFLIALFLIAIVLVAQFNSIGQPIIIMTSVFLSLGGVFWGYFLTRQVFVVIMSGIGCISLAGVAVNNCIVLVDYTNKLIAYGETVSDAVVNAGETRLRPVILTAGTTVLGLIPMALGISIDIHPSSFGIQTGSEMTEFWAAFAWAMIYGLTFATVMTLIMVPCMLSLYFKWFPPKRTA
ncbi:MAG TPA: efflux RND transporter permease subunit [Chitinispirillaceae bacterium]|nr:efflux RND transporter permease subunit [Chitinispirillaceae bacterium]